MSLNLLTASELRIIEKLCIGKLYKEIAHESHISINTVKKHLKNIYRKLDVSNRKHACHKFNELPMAV